MKKNWIIILILFFSLFFRVWGVGYGLPDFVIGDEKSIVSGTLKMVELKTLIPAFHPVEFRPMYYPPLIAYIYLIFLIPVIGIKYLIGNFSSLIDFKNYLILNSSIIWVTIRVVSVLMGTVTVYLIYLAGKKLFNKQVGLLSALFLSLSFLHLQLSHFARHWVPALFFISLVILFSVYLYQNPQRKYYILTGIFLGLAFGASYITAVSLIIFLAAHFLAKKERFFNKLKDKNFWLTLLIFFLLAIIFIVLHPQEFFRVLFGEDTGAKEVKTIFGLFSTFVYHFKNLYYFEPVISIFSLLGAVILYLQSKKKLILLLVIPIFYLLSLYLLFHSEVRYTVLIVPLLSILSGFGLDFIFQQLSDNSLKKYLVTLILFLVFLYPLAVAFKYDYLLTQKDSQILAKDWIQANISAGEKIATDFYDFKLTPTKESITRQQSLDSESLRVEEKTLMTIADDKYPVPAFDVLPLHFIKKGLPADILSYLQKNQYHYFSVSYWDKKELSQFSQQLIGQLDLIKEFSGSNGLDIHGNTQDYVAKIFQLNNLGPRVEIYQIVTQ